MSYTTQTPHNLNGTVPEGAAALADHFLSALEVALRPLFERLVRIEHQLALNIEKESYTVEEAAERLSRSAWTVRQWCNKGQVQGARKVRGKGRMGEWRIPHEELVRLQNEGPLPEGRHRSV